jgi:sialic acid synthase SpsE
MSVFIIAEVGINHEGDINIAKKMVDSAKECGVDCVKFQTFKASEFVSNPTQTYTYQSQGKEITESMLEMFQRYEFNDKDWIEIIEYCQQKDIVFCSTAQNPSDLDYLFSLTELPFIKVGSDDLTNLELMKHYALKQKPMMISAGMAYASEIEDAVMAIREVGNDDITVLHCVSSYPTMSDEVNLKKIPIIKDAFNVDIGFSDHTIGSSAAVGSVCFGATVIEKHFTLDNDASGPDHWFSITPCKLKQYVDDIRFIEKAIGKSTLRPTEKELDMRNIARRKIVFDQDLNKGDIVTNENITFKRSEENDGLSPKEVKFIINRSLKSMVKKGDAVTLENLR